MTRLIPYKVKSSIDQRNNESETFIFDIANNSLENHFQYQLLSNDISILAGINYINYLIIYITHLEIFILVCNKQQPHPKIKQKIITTRDKNLCSLSM